MEIWRPVPGYEGRYEASNLGEVRSTLRGVLIARKDDRTDYRVVRLYDGEKRRKLFLHAVIARTFHGPRPEGFQIRHLNGDPIDNQEGNLRYGTPRENALDRAKHGTCWESKKEACPRGHQLRGDNLVKGAKRVGKRVCRACGRAATFVGNNPDLFWARDGVADYYYENLNRRASRALIEEYLGEEKIWR